MNKESINNLYLHDYCFIGFNYDYDNRRIDIFCADEFNKIEKIIIENVLYFEMKSCEFWHPSDRIYDICCIENSLQLKELKKEMNEKGYDNNRLTDNVEYLQVCIQLISGDILFVIGESFNIFKINSL